MTYCEPRGEEWTSRGGGLRFQGAGLAMCANAAPETGASGIGGRGESAVLGAKLVKSENGNSCAMQWSSHSLRPPGNLRRRLSLHPLLCTGEEPEVPPTVPPIDRSLPHPIGPLKD